MAETKENNRLFFLHWEFVVGLSLLVITLFVCTILIDIKQVISAFSELDERTIFAISILGTISWFSRAFRMWILFEKLPLIQAIGISFLHNSANNLAPMRLGELTLPALTKWHGNVKFSTGVTHLVWIRLLDLISLLCISSCIIMWSFLGSAILIILVLLIMYMPFLIRTFVPKINLIFLPKIFHQARAQLVLEATRSVRLHRIWHLTVIAWLSKLTGMGVLLTSLSDLKLSTVMATIFGAELSSILPINGFAGIGSYEAGGVLGATIVSQPVAESLALTIQLHIYVLSLTAVFGILGGLLLLRRT